MCRDLDNRISRHCDMTPRSSQKKRAVERHHRQTQDMNDSPVEHLNTDRRALRQHNAVLTCSKCKTIVGDTTSITAVYQLRGVGGHIALGSVTNCVVHAEDVHSSQYARVLGTDHASALIFCNSDSCDQCLGVILADAGTDVLKTSFSLNLNHVERYYLGSADMTIQGHYHDEDDDTQSHSPRLDDLERDIGVLRNHIETIQRVLESHDEELVQQNKRLREHGEVLKHIL